MFFLGYGEYLNGNIIKRYCPSATPLGVAELSGFKLAFCGNETVAIKAEETQSMHVRIYEVNDLETASLISHFTAFPKCFDSIDVAVEFNEKVITALLFVADKDKANFRLPGGAYLDRLTRIYIQNNVGILELFQALETTRKLINGKNVYYWFY